MRIGVLTSTHHRHRYFANYLVHRLPVKVVVSEQKSAEPDSVGRNEVDNELLSRYFSDRTRAEQESLLGGEEFNLSSDTVLVETLPRNINSQEVVSTLESKGIDTLAVFGTSLLKEPLLSMYDGRIVNIHLGLSPYYRGRVRTSGLYTMKTYIWWAPLFTISMLAWAQAR